MPNPLVSICVITYHSEKFVLETLESAKTQTYQNIELIISDDGSTDNTLQLCRDWLAENKDRFVRTELITVEKNTGIPANCNRAVKAAQGEWIKLIAGDDILLDNCVETLVDFSIKTPDAYFIFSEVKFIDDNSEDIDCLPPQRNNFFSLSAKEQYKKLLIARHLVIPAPSSLINKKTLQELDFFDEEIKYCEDYPLWLKCTKENYKLYHISDKLVGYRRHSQSISTGFNYEYHKSLKLFFFKYRFREIMRYRPISSLDLLIYNIFRTYKNYHAVLPYLQPKSYFNFFKRKILRRI